MNHHIIKHEIYTQMSLRVMIDENTSIFPFCIIFLGILLFTFLQKDQALVVSSRYILTMKSTSMSLFIGG